MKNNNLRSALLKAGYPVETINDYLSFMTVNGEFSDTVGLFSIDDYIQYMKQGTGGRNRTLFTNNGYALFTDDNGEFWIGDAVLREKKGLPLRFGFEVASGAPNLVGAVRWMAEAQVAPAIHTGPYTLLFGDSYKGSAYYLTADGRTRLSDKDGMDNKFFYDDGHEKLFHSLYESDDTENRVAYKELIARLVGISPNDSFDNNICKIYRFCSLIGFNCLSDKTLVSLMFTLGVPHIFSMYLYEISNSLVYRYFNCTSVAITTKEDRIGCIISEVQLRFGLAFSAIIGSTNNGIKLLDFSKDTILMLYPEFKVPYLRKDEFHRLKVVSAKYGKHSKEIFAFSESGRVCAFFGFVAPKQNNVRTCDFDELQLDYPSTVLFVTGRTKTVDCIRNSGKANGRKEIKLKVRGRYSEGISASNILSHTWSLLELTSGIYKRTGKLDIDSFFFEQELTAVRNSYLSIYNLVGMHLNSNTLDIRHCNLLYAWSDINTFQGNNSKFVNINTPQYFTEGDHWLLIVYFGERSMPSKSTELPIKNFTECYVEYGEDGLIKEQKVIYTRTLNNY